MSGNFNLLIVESPKKARTIQDFMPPGWRVAASFGHILDLPEHDIGVAPPDFRPKYEPSRKTGAKAISELKALVAQASNVYLGTDPDREGEAISAHIAKRTNVKNPKRTRFGSVSKADVMKAIENPTEINYDLVEAQEARRVLDRLVGYMVSPKLGRVTGLEKMSAGRVQSPAVRLVVERERAITAFKATPFYDVLLRFSTNGLEWGAAWDPTPYLQEGAEHCTDKALAEDVAATSPVNVTAVERTQEQRRPKAPFTTSTIQQAASVSLKLRPKETMTLAQELFDAGWISYHRTDNPNLDAETSSAIRAWLMKNGHANALPVKPFVWPSKASAQEAHPGISPKHVEIPDIAAAAPAELAKHGLKPVSAEAQPLYRLIWLRAVASQMKAAALDVTTIILDGSSPQGREVQFGARGAVIIDAGWMALYQVADEESDDGDDDNTSRMPALTAGQSLKPTSGEVQSKKTRPPPRFTEAKLVKALEDMGIGRPATYAEIINNIIKREYVKVDRQRQLHALARGMLLCDLLVPVFRFMDYAFTETLETYLDKIAKGEAKYEPLMANMYGLLSKELAELKSPAPHLVPEELRGSLQTMPNETYPCPTCNEGKLVRRKGNNGFFWGCDRYDREHPEHGCRHTQPDEKGRPGERKQSPSANRA